MIPLCSFCTKNKAVYEGWFYAVQKNWFNEKTADSGLLQLREVCSDCLEKEEINQLRYKTKPTSQKGNGL